MHTGLAASVSQGDRARRRDRVVRCQSAGWHLRGMCALAVAALALAGCSFDTAQVAAPHDSQSVTPSPTPEPTPSPEPSTTMPSPEPTTTGDARPASWWVDLDEIGWTVEPRSTGGAAASNDDGCALVTTEMDYSAPFLQGDDYGATEDFSGTIINATAANYTLTSQNSRGIETIPAKDGGEAIEGLSFDLVYEHSELGTLNSWMWMRVFTDPQAPRAVYVILQCQQDKYSEDIRNQIRDDGYLTLVGGQPASFDR